jgi:hypothetical protein
MNQRPAKTHRAALGQDGRVSLNEVIAFFENAESTLEREGQEDAAFYFGQVADHLRKNPHKGFNETVTRILGV